MKKEYKNLQSFITKKVTHYKKKLLSDIYTINIQFKATKDTSLATTTTIHPYNDVYIIFDLEKLLEYYKKDKEYVESVVIHELLHIHLSRFEKVARERLRKKHKKWLTKFLFNIK